jgi:hypothetical protein
VKLRPGVITPLLAAMAGGSALAAIVASAGAVTAPAPITLGSTTGTPSANVCSGGINCTYVPFSGAADPALAVPSDGTVSSFAVNSGSATGSVELRVLAPAGNGRYTGAGTSAPQALAGGVQSFSVSLPVTAGDVLALDNASSALLFDTTSPTAISAYYEVPSLADGSTAAPNHDQSGLRLLLSAVEQPSTSTTVTTNPTVTTVVSTTTVTTTQATPSSPGPPKILSLRQSQRTWREGSKLAVVAGARVPVGTVFSFTLNQRAVVTVSFVQPVAGRKVKGKCVAGSKAKGSRCTVRTTQGTLAISGAGGANQLSFQGKLTSRHTLPTGSYTVKLQARNAAGQSSSTRSLSFTIAR